eukprot:31461-Rhodomonas_salina.3
MTSRKRRRAGQNRHRQRTATRRAKSRRQVREEQCMCMHVYGPPFSHAHRRACPLRSRVCARSVWVLGCERGALGDGRACLTWTRFHVRAGGIRRLRLLRAPQALQRHREGCCVWELKQRRALQLKE